MSLRYGFFCNMEDSPPSAITARINTLKIDVASCKARIIELFPTAVITQVRWYDSALIIDHVERTAFLESLFVREGWCYPQGLASQLPVVVLHPQPHERVLDMCAAPGSKTTQLAAHMQNTGEIIANDVSRTRVFKLSAIAKRLGATSIKTVVGKGEFLWRRNSSRFDRVLLDAPCSMDQALPPKQIKALARQQSYLLRSALACVKPGGSVVYSTCTSRREENEDVVRVVLDKVSDAHIEPITLPGIFPEWMTSEGYVRIPKDAEYESFFVASFIRTGSDVE